jgi:hypothetical protein
MRTPAQQISIQWPLKALFHYLCDIETYSAWQLGVSKTEWITKNRHCKGAWFKEIRTINGKREEILIEVSAHQPFQSRVLTFRKGNWQAVLTMEFIALPESTVVKVDVEVTTTEPLSWVEGFLAGRILSTKMDELRSLKVQLESECEQANPDLSNNKMEDFTSLQEGILGKG